MVKNLLSQVGDTLGSFLAYKLGFRGARPHSVPSCSALLLLSSALQEARYEHHFSGSSGSFGSDGHAWMQVVPNALAAVAQEPVLESLDDSSKSSDTYALSLCLQPRGGSSCVRCVCARRSRAMLFGQKLVKKGKKAGGGGGAELKRISEDGDDDAGAGVGGAGAGAAGAAGAGAGPRPSISAASASAGSGGSVSSVGSPPAPLVELHELHGEDEHASDEEEELLMTPELWSALATPGSATPVFRADH